MQWGACRVGLPGLCATRLHDVLATLYHDGRHRLSALWTPTQSKKRGAADDGIEDGIEDGHDLLVRAAFLRQAQPGIFHALPLGLRVLNKVERLIDRHMQPLGASKLSLSSLSAQHLWRQSGRLDARNSELFQLKDRKHTPFLLAPTHEEEITNIVRHAVRSYKDLPLRLYQVSRKYRDEARPRQGLLRGREFIMKDLYTFDLTSEQAMHTYRAVQNAYKAFLDDLKLPYLVAAADSGSMGGAHSHEYHFASPRGEDTIITCAACKMSINEELYAGKHHPTAESSPGEHDVPYAIWVGRTLRLLHEKLPQPQSGQEMEKFQETRNQTWEEYEEEYARQVLQWKEDDRTEATIKVYYPQGSEINIHAIKRLYPNLDTSSANDAAWVPASDGDATHIRDPRVLGRHLQVPERGFFRVGKRDVKEAPFLLTKASENDACPQCEAKALQLHQAVEIGHTFHLGSRYSRPLHATVQNDSNELVDIEMGCHGVGVSRLVGAAASLLADSKGLNWPLIIAPFSMVLVGTASASVDEIAELYDHLTHHLRQSSDGDKFDAVIDDRERPVGWKLNDADLIGYPFVVVLGKAWKQRKAVELQARRLSIREEVGVEELVQKIATYSQRL